MHCYSKFSYFVQAFVEGNQVYCVRGERQADATEVTMPPSELFRVALMGKNYIVLTG